MSCPKHFKAIQDSHDDLSGTALPSKLAQAASVLFVACVLLLCASLFLCMPLAPQDESLELQELHEYPQPVLDGHANVGFLAQWGDWFNDHFAFRQQLITVNSHLQSSLLDTSPTTQVIVGREGYLFYGGTLADYQHSNPLSDRALDNAAFNLALMQEYVESQGARFVLAVAPNKNSLYGRYMPYYYLPGEGAGNWDRLKERLDDRGVQYVDLFQVLGDSKSELYLKTDSHWNTQGAYLGFCAIAEKLAQSHLDYSTGAVSQDTNFVGDLEAMLYPVGRTPEPVEVYEQARRFDWVKGVVATDATIATHSQDKGMSGSLVAYRDSFGNALVPFLATAYHQAFFSKLVPYDLGAVSREGATAVLVERAERHLSFFATTPPIMEAPRRALVMDGSQNADVSVKIEDNGPYWRISGRLPNDWGQGSESVYLGLADPLNTEWREAFWYTILADEEEGEPGSDYGFVANVSKSAVAPGQSISLAVTYRSQTLELKGCSVVVP